MNIENLKKVIDNYKEKIDFLYNSENDELYKWRALKVFKDNWNIEEKDFVEMIKRSTKEMYNLVDNRMVQPLSGLIKLAEYEPETVRKMFRDLEYVNHLSVEERQSSIDEFKKGSEGLIKKYYNGSWRYAQSTRDVIFYLNMLNPSNNYIYKYSVSKKMAECLEISNYIGSGEHFKLKMYYEMCDKIKEYIMKDNDFIKLHKSYLNDSCYCDENLNVLIYDIIYCADTYNLYGNISIKKNNQNSKELRIVKIKNDLELLYKQQNETKKNLIEIEEVIENLEEINVIDELVKHSKFGDGKIIEQNNNSISVKFDNDDVKKFSIPIAFSKGFLKIENKNIIEKSIELENLEIEKNNIIKKLSKIDMDIQMLKKQLS